MHWGHFQGQVVPGLWQELLSLLGLWNLPRSRFPGRKGRGLAFTESCTIRPLGQAFYTYCLTLEMPE